MLIKMNGKPYKLLYDFNSMVEMEEQLGMSVNEMLTVNKSKLGYKAIRAFLYAGLHANYPELDINDVGNLLYDETRKKKGRLEEIVSQIFKCMKQDGLIEDEVVEDEDSNEGNYNNMEKKI